MADAAELSLLCSARCGQKFRTSLTASEHLAVSAAVILPLSLYLSGWSCVTSAVVAPLAPDKAYSIAQRTQARVFAFIEHTRQSVDRRGETVWVTESDDCENKDYAEVET